MLLRWLGSGIRVATTRAQLGGDPVVLINHALGVVGCSLLLLQLWRYNWQRANWYTRAGSAAARASLENLEVVSSKPAAALMWLSLGGFGALLPTNAEIRAAFDVIDVDGNGSITSDELMKAISRVPSQEMLEAVATMIEFADADNDGSIDFEEFKQAVTVAADRGS